MELLLRTVPPIARERRYVDEEWNHRLDRTPPAQFGRFYELPGSLPRSLRSQEDTPPTPPTRVDSLPEAGPPRSDEAAGKPSAPRWPEGQH